MKSCPYYRVLTSYSFTLWNTIWDWSRVPVMARWPYKWGDHHARFHYIFGNETCLFFVRSGSDGLLKLWTIKNNECVKTFDEHKDKVWALATTSDETSLITGGGDSNIIVWKVGCRDNTFVFSFLLVPIWKVFVEYSEGAIGILQDLYSSFGFSRQESSQRIFHLHLFLSSASSSVTSTTAMSSPIFCILLRHSNYCHVLSGRIPVPTFRPSPFPLSWQFHRSSNTPIIFPPYMCMPPQSCLVCFLSKPSHLRCPPDVLISDLIHLCQS